jgi:hypothetical protein
MAGAATVDIQLVRVNLAWVWAALREYSVELFIQDHAFWPSYGLAPPPPPLPSVTLTVLQ